MKNEMFTDKRMEAMAKDLDLNETVDYSTCISDVLQVVEDNYQEDIDLIDGDELISAVKKGFSNSSEWYELVNNVIGDYIYEKRKEIGND